MKILINKKICILGLIVCLFLLSYLLIGCTGYLDIFLRKQNIGKLIYTTNVTEYIENRNIIYEGSIKDYIDTAQGSSGMEYPEEFDEKLWILSRNEDNRYDIVIQSTKMITFGNDTAILGGMNLNFGYIPINCSRIFSPYINGVMLELICATENCSCYWDSFDGCSCKLNSTPTELYLDHEITEQDYFDNGVCIACWNYSLIYYDEISNIYQYSPTNICQCNQPLATGEGVAGGLYFNCQSMEQYNDYIIFPQFDELIIDGFDFNVIYTLLNDLNLNSYNLTNYKDPNDFSYMFADLPVETITLKNIKGQDKIKDLSHMFENCDNLKTINWGNFFENLQPTNLSNMFFNCPNLKNINLSGLDTSKVTDMSNMFNIHASQGQLIEEFIQSSAFNAVFPTNIPTEYKNINNIYQLNLIGDIEDLISYLKCFNLNPFTGLPITYSELVEIYMGKPYEEVLQDIITANSISQEEAIILIQNNVDEQLNSLLGLYPDEEITTSLITDKQLLDIINNFTPNGTLDISGFIINENTDTTNMFGNACNFANIQGPSYVANGIEINLPFNYIANEKNTKSINSQNSNSLFEYTKEPIQEPEEPDEPNPDNPNPDEPDNPNTPQTPKDKNLALYISLGIIGGIIILISIIAIIILIKRKNKTNITNDSDNSEQNK